MGVIPPHKMKGQLLYTQLKTFKHDTWFHISKVPPEIEYHLYAAISGKNATGNYGVNSKSNFKPDNDSTRISNVM